MNQTHIRRRRLAALFLTLILMLAMAPAALADTDENTPRITQQPDQLVLQLGVRWAGVEFELRTDAGRFPVPVVVDESGVLTMDLGGSTTYTLSCMNSSVPVPSPDSDPEQLPEEELSTPPAGKTERVESSSSHLVLIIVILIVVVIALLGLLFYSKRQQQDMYDSWEDEEEAL